MHVQQRICRLKVRDLVVFVSFLMFWVSPQIGFSQQGVTAQPADASMATASSEAKASVAKPTVSVQPRLQAPIHIVPFREPGTVTTRLNAFPVGSHVDYFGGPVISNVHVVLVLYGPGGYLPNIAGTTAPTMANFYNDITKSTFFDMLSEYSTTGVTAVGGQAGTNQFIGHGFFDGQFTINPATVNNGATITDNQIQAELLSQVNAGNLPAPVIDAQGNSNTLYMIFFPPGKTINDGTSNSCVKGGFCAYHNSTNASFGTHRLFYGVMPDLQPPSGCSTGCGGSSVIFDNATNVTSHELSEAVTDADVGPATSFGPPLAWLDEANGEIGDICVAQEVGVVANGTTYTVQQEFSNLQNNCVSAPPQFQLTPTTNVSVGSPFGVKLSVNGSTTSTPLSGYTGTVHFTSSDPTAVLPADFTFQAADAGAHDFIVTMNTTGQQTLTVTDTHRPGFNGVTQVPVTTGVVHGFRIAAQGTATTGSPSTLVVQAVDSSNFAVSSYSGTVHFTSSDASAVLPINTALTNGTGTFTATFNTAGTQTITASDVSNTALTGAGQIKVAAPAGNPTTTTLTTSQPTSTFGQTISVSMSVTGVGVAGSTANFDITVDGSELVFGSTQGTAVQTIAQNGGKHTIFANYFGDATRGASSSAPLTIQVNPASVPITISASSTSVALGTPVTLFANFNGPISNQGTFTFFDGTSPLGVTSGSTTSLVVTGLTVGTHSISASYSGSADIVAATSATITVTVAAPPPADYSINTSQSISVLAGQAAQLTINTQSLNGFFGTVKFSCGNLPALVTCTFAPATTTVTPAVPFASTGLTIKTTGPHAALIMPRSTHSLYAMLWRFAPFSVGFVLLVGRKRSVGKAKMLTGLCALVMVAGMASCGGGGGTPTQTIVGPSVTPAGTTTIVVTATGTAITGASPANPSQQVSITLTVQP